MQNCTSTNLKYFVWNRVELCSIEAKKVKEDGAEWQPNLELLPLHLSRKRAHDKRYQTIKMALSQLTTQVTFAAIQR